jgi:glycosyltransferase involved in cell wall biosynthesis
MKRKRILSIGGDTSIFDATSQFRTRFLVYDSYHTFTLVILNTGEKQKITLGHSQVIQPGGKNVVTAFVRTFFYTVQLVSREKFDLITTQDVLYSGLLGFVISKLKRLPLYVQLHGDYLDNERWFKSKVGSFNRIMNVIGKFILKRADHVRVVSQRLKEQVVAQHKLDENRVVSIPIGTDMSMFVPPDSMTREPIIAFAQRLILEKQPMLFVAVTIEVMQQFPEIRVVIAGDGPMKADMQSAYAATGLQDRVTFLGSVKQAELVSLYQSAKCYLHTADWEGWGMPMIEAMATGCPVVTTNTGCAGEVVKDGENGFVTPINDKVALVHAVQTLLSDEVMWQRFSKRGIIEAQAWSFDSLARKNMEWYANKS